MLEKLFPYCSDSLANVLKEPMVSELKAFPQSGGTVGSGQKSLDDKSCDSSAKANCIILQFFILFNMAQMERMKCPLRFPSNLSLM